MFERCSTVYKVAYFTLLLTAGPLHALAVLMFTVLAFLINTCGWASYLTVNCTGLVDIQERVLKQTSEAFLKKSDHKGSDLMNSLRQCWIKNLSGLLEYGRLWG